MSYLGTIIHPALGSSTCANNHYVQHIAHHRTHAVNIFESVYLTPCSRGILFAIKRRGLNQRQRAGPALSTPPFAKPDDCLASPHLRLAASHYWTAQSSASAFSASAWYFSGLNLPLFHPCALLVSIFLRLSSTLTSSGLKDQKLFACARPPLPPGLEVLLLRIIEKLSVTGVDRAARLFCAMEVSRRALWTSLRCV